MKRKPILVRLREGLACMGLVLLDDLRGLLRRRRAPGRKGAKASAAAGSFPPGDWRRKALDDFASWLREMDAPPPATHAPDLSEDLFSMVTEVSALRVELKRQTREQSKTNEGLAHLGGVCREVSGRLGEQGEKLAALHREIQRESQGEIQREIQRETEKSVFLLFADIRDALKRGLDEAGRVPVPVERGFFRRPAATTSREAVEEGYRIALARFDRAMAHLGIRKVLTSGQPFDPGCMVAVAARNEPDIDTGTVLDESLSGYVRGEEVLRAAHVVVAADTTS